MFNATILIVAIIPKIMAIMIVNIFMIGRDCIDPENEMTMIINLLIRRTFDAAVSKVLANAIKRDYL